MDHPDDNGNQAITRSASKVILGGMFTLVASMISQMVVAAMYGAGAGMDAYLTASVIPTYFQYVLLTGLSFVFIPAFVREESRGEQGDAWALVGTTFWTTAAVLVFIGILGALTARQIISVSAPGFSAAKSGQAAEMLAVLMFTVVFSGLNSLTTGIQNARNRFFWPSVAIAIGQIGNVIVLLLVGHRLGAMALAWGYLVSTIIQAGITVIPILQHGWKNLLSLRDPRVLEMGKLIAPLIFFGLLTRSTSMLERYFASGLPDGQISYIGYANKISNIYVGMLASGISSAIFPSMARAFHRSGLKGLEEKNHYGLRLTFATGLPVIVITAAIALPMVRVLFERGAFLPADTLGTSEIVFGVLMGDLFFRMVGNIFGRTSYVLKDTLTPSLVSSVTVLLYIAAGRYFVNHWGYFGLVWARTLQQGLSVVILGLFVIRKLPNTALVSTLRRLLEYSLAAGAAYLAGTLVISRLAALPALPQGAVAGMAGIAVYLLILYWRDRDMLSAILEITGVGRLWGRVQARQVQPDRRPQDRSQGYREI